MFQCILQHSSMQFYCPYIEVQKKLEQSNFQEIPFLLFLLVSGQKSEVDRIWYWFFVKSVKTMQRHSPLLINERNKKRKRLVKWLIMWGSINRVFLVFVITGLWLLSLIMLIFWWMKKVRIQWLLWFDFLYNFGIRNEHWRI